MKKRLPQLCIIAIAAACLEYWAVLVYCDVWRPEPLGLRLTVDAGGILVESVAAGTPAELAGIQPNDRLTSAAGHAIGNRLDWMAIEGNLQVGRPLQLSLMRNGSGASAQITPGRASWTSWRDEHGLELLVVRLMLLVTILVATFVALKRPRDATALVGSAFLGTIGVFSVTLPYQFASVWRSLPWLARLPLWLPFMSSVAVAAWGYSFFAMFPRVRFRTRLAWYAIWALMIPGLIGQALFGWHAVVRAQPAPRFPLWPESLIVLGAGYLAAALIRLVLTYTRLTDVSERRRVRVVMIGSLVGALGGAPVVLSYWRTATNRFSEPLLGTPIAMLGTFLFLALPISFAYAILRHRLFDISMIVRQGLRYVLARRVLLALVPVMGVLLGVDLLAHGDEPVGVVLRSRAWLYGGAVVLALVARTQQQTWLEGLDRRFFRERYNAQRLLREVAEEVRHATSLDPVAHSLVSRIEQALHPEFVALLVREAGGGRYRTIASSPGDHAPPDLQPDAAAVELVVPVPAAAGDSAAVFVFGAKRSEEPYTADDRDLLMAIAENIALRVSNESVAIAGFDECPACGACYPSGTERCAADGSWLAPVSVPASLLERYRIERRIGRGGMGTVYVARDTLLDRRVAAKLVHEDLIGEPGAAERFQREARATAGFSHPNVVTVHDFGVSGTRAFLVMELLEGQTLREALRVDERIDCQRSLAILRDVTAAVEAAHRRQLVHRDLKPENIWLVSDGSHERAKVLDFGLATCLAPADADGAAPPGGGTVQGTPFYMAPEQIRGEEPDAAWDVWALAVIAFEMVSGSHPFALTTFARSGPARDSAEQERLAGLPIGLRPYFARALAIRRDARPGSAAMLLQEFEQSLHA